jgi:hypothetical protein
MLLKDKFNDPKNVNVDVFVELANNLLHAELTSGSTLMEVIRAALECNDTIAFITEGGHSRSLQMRNREGLKDYVSSVLPQTSEDSIAALGKETPLVITNNELSVSKEEENENSDRPITKVEMMKYLMIIDHYKLPYNIIDFIHNKEYRQDSIKKGELYQHLKTFGNVAEKESNKFSEYWERISGLKILLKKPNDNKKKAKEMVKYMKLMKHYKIECNLSEFVFNKYYREEMMKNIDTNNVKSTKITKEKKVDDKLDYDFTSESDDEKYDKNEFLEQIELQLDEEDEYDNEEIVDEDDNDGDVINKSITALDKEVPPVISNNELNVTEKSEGDTQKQLKQLLKHVFIILYYKLDINANKFITDGSYREEMIKGESFKEHLKKFDEEEKVEIFDYEYVNGKFNIKYKGVLSGKGNSNNNIIKDSITTVAEETPAVINNELKVTESKVKVKKEKKKKEPKEEKKEKK